MIDFHMGFDPGSLAELVRFAGFSSLLNPAITSGLTEAGQLLVDAARANTWQVFDNPTGALAESIYFYVISPDEVAVAVGVPYGRRREFGFSGMTDSLGRYYAYDPGKPYLAPALADNEQRIADIIAVAVESALGRIAV